MKSTIAFASLLCLSLSGFTQEKHLLTGSTVDAVSGQPLPFVSIVLKENNRGLMSNDRGSFQLTVDETMLDDSLLFSCIGYQMARLAVSEITDSKAVIALEPKVFELSEVEIFPLLPEEYIRIAVEKIPENYADTPSISKGYYSELMSENKRFLKFEEAVTDTWVPAVGDSTDAHTSVLYARTAKDLVELQFMKEKREKKAAKAARKRAKNKDNDSDEDVAEEVNDEIVSSNFGGPSTVLKSDPVRNHHAFMKPENFSKFNYHFEPQVAFGDKKLMVIAFDQKKKVDQMSVRGKVYIDMNSDAIVAVESAGYYKIPTVMKPVLFAMGYGIDNPQFSAMVHYREHHGLWYVNSVKHDIQIALTKKYMFSKNETSDFDIEQVYTVQELNTTSAAPIDEKLRMTSEKTMVEQAQFNEESFWDSYTTVRPQKLEAYLKPAN